MESQTSRAALVTHGINLEYLTVGWNLLEGLVSLIAAAMAGSIALVGFGVDSWIETSSGAILLWRLHAERRGQQPEVLERRAIRFIGAGFLFLAFYILADSISALWKREATERSIIGIVIASLSLVVMPLLARAKRKTAKAISSAALEADSRQTSICAYLSVILLAGLLLNALFKLWWADPVAALIMVPIITKEGINGVRGESCTDCRGSSLSTLK